MNEHMAEFILGPYAIITLLVAAFIVGTMAGLSLRVGHKPTPPQTPEAVSVGERR